MKHRLLRFCLALCCAALLAACGTPEPDPTSVPVIDDPTPAPPVADPAYPSFDPYAPPDEEQ